MKFSKYTPCGLLSAPCISALESRDLCSLSSGRDLLKECFGLDPRSVHQPTDLVAALQGFEAVRDHGEGALKKMFELYPAKYLPTVNTLCRRSNLEVRRSKQRLTGARPSSLIKLARAPAEKLRNSSF